MEKDNCKPLLYFTREATWMKKDEVNDNIVSDKGPLRSDGTQRKSRRIFWRINGVCDVARLKPLGRLVVDVSMQEKKIRS